MLALENGSFDDIPGKTYVNGYLKIYSHFLGIEDEISKIQKILPVKVTKLTKAKKHINDNWLLGSLFALFIIIAIFAIFSKSDSSKNKNNVMNHLIKGIVNE